MGMTLGIDASNIIAGGGVTHLSELFRKAEPEVSGFSKVVIWSGKNTLDQLENMSWLEKVHFPILDKGVLFRGLWQKFQLSKQAQMRGCDLLYVPGGSFSGSFRPVVSCSQNILPFDWRELIRYRVSWMTLKMLLLRVIQSRTFQKSAGVIYLTQYAKSTVEKVIGKTPGQVAMIAHGIDQRFFKMPRDQKHIGLYSSERPFKIIYVSTVDFYKHQWKVVEAISELKNEGFAVTLELVGPNNPKAMRKLQRVIKHEDPKGEFVAYTGPIPFRELHKKYSNAELCVFASSCENLPIILLEAMASGLPIACSDRGPMPEILKDAGVYFDPEESSSIAGAVRSLLISTELRETISNKAYLISHNYSWQKCAMRTLDFLKYMTVSYKKGEFNI
jgi:glycosyltransferase involved in cell wall biosynthesis